MKTKLILLLLVLLSFATVSAQTQEIDSLENLLRKHTSLDTTRVNLLNAIAYKVFEQRADVEKVRNYGEQSGEIADKLNYQKGKAASLWIIGLAFINSDREKSLDYSQKALAFAEKIGDKTLIWHSLISLGSIKKSLGDMESSDEFYERSFQIANELQNKLFIIKSAYNKALNQGAQGHTMVVIELLQKALPIAIEIDEKPMLSRIYRQLAMMYNYWGNSSCSLEYYLSALKITEQMDDKSGMFINYINIAGLQSAQKNYESAISHLKKAFLLSRDMKDSLRMSVCFTNIGNVYLSMKRPDALQYFQKALKIAKGKDIPQSINILINIGAIYTERREFDKAKQNLEEALALIQKAGLKRFYSEAWIKMGLLYFEQKKYELALTYTQKAFDLSKEIGVVEYQKDCSKLLSDIYAAIGNYNKAYLNHIEYKVLSDSLFNEENVRKMTSLESAYKYDKERQQHEMEKASHELEIKNQKQTILFLIIVSLLVLMLAFAIYWSNKLKKKVLKLEIENINSELETNQKAIAAATLKLVQNSERDTYSIKMLESIKKNTVDEGQNEIRSLIADYKRRSSSSNWEEFEIMFEKVSSSFYEKLNEQFPTLTPNERKLCVFLKLNMSNDHISQVTFQSEEALKKARLRLRKKLGIDRDTNLVAFIQSL